MQDDLYLQQSIEACHDVVRRLFGAVTALQYARETKLLATLMYHGLTTGAGLQTLGEEYCDMVQVVAAAGGAGGAATAMPALRVLLALLKALGPYVGEQLVASVGRGAAALEALNVFDEPDAQQPPPVTEGQREAGASSLPRCGPQAVDTSQPPAASLRQLALGWRAAAGDALAAGRRQLVTHWPQVQEWLLFAARLHLALFYLYGAYYQPSHRLLRVRYASISSQPDRSTSYRVLGVLLSLQLALTAAARAQPHISRWGGTLVGGAQGALPQHPQHAVVLPDAPPVGKSASGSSASGTGIVVVEAPPPALPGTARHTCALCLSPRSNPTCTPCGHVFCWHCIVQWCNEKPECPLCRSSVVSQQLVCLAHSDF